MKAKQLLLLSVCTAAIVAAVFYFLSAKEFLASNIFEIPVVSENRPTDPSGASAPEKITVLFQNTSQFPIQITSQIFEAWGVPSGFEVLKKTESLELVESRLNILLYMVRSSCKVANFRASKLKNPRGQIEIDQKIALETFLSSYCGDVTKLDLLITQRLGPNDAAFKARPHDEDTMVLLAAKPSNEVANALINEVLSASDVDLARLTAPLISELTKVGGPLESWQEFLPGNPSFEELNSAYTIAGEIIGCQFHRGCGPNEILSMHECLMGRGCKPGEDLLSYRRRTTSPMLYQAAEQIAAAMQARRYR